MPPVEWVDSFGDGVVMTLPKNKIPKSAFSFGINTALLPHSGGGMVVTKRPGFNRKDTHIGAGYVTGMAFFGHNSSGTITNHLIGVTSEGTIDAMADPAGQLTIPTTNTEFSSSTLSGATNGVRFAQANNCLFGVTGGSSFKIVKQSGTLYVRAFGGRAPTSAPTGTLGGASSGVMNGTWEFICTFYNSLTGVESGVSPTYTPIALVNQNIDINVSGIGTPNLDFDKVNIYVRNPELGIEFVRNAAMQVTLGDVSTIFNISTDDYKLLTIRAPQTNSNAPLPSGITDICWHLSRMFATDGVKLYYSKVGEPENWNTLNYENANPNDGQKIIALHSVNEMTLLILKERSAYLLVGDTSQSWEVHLLTQSIGCTAKMSVCEGDGLIAWWSHVGPVIWTKQGEPMVMDENVVRELYRQNQISVNNYNTLGCTAYDPRNKRFLFSFTPKTSSSYEAKGLTILPFSVVNKVWESSGWDFGTVYALCTGVGNNNEFNIFFSSTNQDIYEVSDSFVTDGAQNQTGANLFYNITNASSNSVQFVASTPPYNTRRSYLKVINTSTGEVHRSAYTLSGSGTLTATLTTAFGTTPPVGSILTFDLPVMEMESAVFDGGNPVGKKRYLHTYLRGVANGDNHLIFTLFLDNVLTPKRLWNVKLSEAGWEYGTGGTIASSVEQFRGRIAAVGEEALLRIVGYYPSTRWLISGYGLGSFTTYER